MKNRTWVEVNSEAIKHNLEQARKLLKNDVKLMTVVKANAYGHDLLSLVSVLAEAGIDWLGVDSLKEALVLRKKGIKLPILILGYVLKDNLLETLKNNVSFVVYNKETIQKLGSLKEKAKIHIKVETGTMRQGVFVKDLSKFIQLIKKYPNIEIEGVYTHFANIEDTTNHGFAKKQLRAFSEAINVIEKEKIKPIIHSACSAALILYPETHFDMVRLGISLYGYWSSPQTIVSARNLKRKVELKPALTWKTRIAQIKKVASGSSIGYGLTEKINQDKTIAIVPVGYWDGYDRKLSSIGNVLVRGERCKILGRICMNMLMIDISHLKQVNLEDEVVLIGRQGKEEISVEEIAQKISTINYEVITRINPLIPRLYV